VSSFQALTRLAGGLGLAAAAILPAGCIRSRVDVTSDPPGAEVIWRGKPYGATPVTIPFVWYWHYDVALEKPGYKRLETSEYFRTPPWLLMPFDLFAEALPVPISDTRKRNYVLEPAAGPELPSVSVTNFSLPENPAALPAPAAPALPPSP
jgi:hypothetical protein